METIEELACDYHGGLVGSAKRFSEHITYKFPNSNWYSTLHKHVRVVSLEKLWNGYMPGGGKEETKAYARPHVLCLNRWVGPV